MSAVAEVSNKILLILTEFVVKGVGENHKEHKEEIKDLCLFVAARE